MRFYSKSDLAFESEYLPESDPKPQPPKFFQTSHSASKSVGAELEGRKNTSHIMSRLESKGCPRLPYTGFGIRVAGLRGEIFYPLRSGRMMRLAACMLGKAQSCMKNSTYLR